MTRRCRLLRHQPAQGPQAGIDIVRRFRRHACHHQGLRQARVVIGQPLLEPHPVRRLDRCESGHQPVGKRMPDFPGVEIMRSDRAIGIQTQQRERPRPGGAKGRRGRQCLGEQRGSPPAPRRTCIAARGLAQCPKRSPVTVFGATVFKPGPVEAHEVAKPPGVGIPGMLHERRKAGRQDFRQGLFARIVEGAGQQQRTSIVVDAIAVRTIGNRLHRMLKQAGIVAHRQEMADLHVRRRRAARLRQDHVGARNDLEPVTLARILEDRHVTLGGALPCHRSADRIGALAYRLPASVVGEQFRDFVADRGRVAERNQNAASIGQQFAGVPVRRRDDRLAEPEAVGQRSRRHLRLVEIGRDIDVAHRDEFEQRGLIDELVEEHHVILDAKFAHPRHQAFAIGLALVPDQIGMRCAEHDVDRIRTAFQNRRHGVDHDFDALVGRQQAEGQNDRLAGKSEPGLRRIGRDKGDVRNAVGYHLDLVVRHPIDAAQQLPALVGHHHHLRRGLDDAIHHRALRRRRIGQHGMERRHHRHRETRQQHEDVGAGFAAENSEFVLQAHGVEPAGVQEIRRTHVLFDIVVLDLETDRRRIIIGLTVIGHRHDAGLRIRS